jgi:hypothetical protein
VGLLSAPPPFLSQQSVSAPSQPFFQPCLIENLT